MSDVAEPEEEKAPYLYIVVRADLPLKVQIVNISHAASECIIEAPIPKTTRSAILHARDEAELLLYAMRAKEKGFEVAVVREPDAPYHNVAMAIGLAPSTRRNQLRKLFHHLPKAEWDAATLPPKGDVPPL